MNKFIRKLKTKIDVLPASSRPNTPIVIFLKKNNVLYLFKFFGLSEIRHIQTKA